MKILVINGANMNMLGRREPDIYGKEDYAALCARIYEHAQSRGVAVECFQSNHEGELIEKVHAAADAGHPVIINPGGFTHTSVALRDALAEVADGAGFVEVHISNVHAREPFRHHSYLSPIASGVIAGLGVFGYVAAVDYLCQ